MLGSKNLKMSRDLKDCCDLFDFATGVNRPQSEIDGYINSLAHQKYPFGNTLRGHELRMQYKFWLRHKLEGMLIDYYFRKNNRVKPITLNNSKV